MRWLDKNINILQDIDGARNNDWCAEAGMRYDQDSRRDEYNNYGDGRNNFESKYQ